MTDKRATMADVAKAAGVSQATVSRALRDDPCITEKVRQEVKACAVKLNYAPNPLVQALMTQRRRKLGSHGETIAFVTSVNSQTWQSKAVCRWYWQGLEERCEELGYQLEVFTLDEKEGGAKRLQKVLTTRGIRGVILGFSQHDEAAAAAAKALSLAMADYCVVGLGTYFPRLLVDRAELHGFFNVKLAFEKMREMGYKRPALIAPVRNNIIVGGQWSAAALNEQWQRPREEQCPPFMVEGDQVNMLKFREWFEAHEPDALLVYKFDVMELLQRLRLSVPEDVGVAYLFGSEKERQTMAGIDGNLEHVGASAVDLLVQKMHVNDRGLPAHPRDVLTTGSWKDGTTLPWKAKKLSPPKRIARPVLQK